MHPHYYWVFTQKSAYGRDTHIAMFTALLHMTAKYRTNLDVSDRTTNRECKLHTIERPSVINKITKLQDSKKAETAEDDDTQQSK